jgi:peptide-methionine (S)-S-oxide reductase
MTGHNEVVQIIYDPSQASLESLLKVFWEGHNPTQGMRQGNDRGTQYRSGIYVPPGEGLALAKQSAARYQTLMTEAGLGKITTEIIPLPRFYYAEDYHQQYLAKNPSGYCGLIPIERSGQPRYPVGD